jgi:hypothetical protein
MRGKTVHGLVNKHRLTIMPHRSRMPCLHRMRDMGDHEAESSHMASRLS